MQQDVRVALDQTGQQSGAGQVDNAGTGGIHCGTGSFDALAAYPHRPAVVHRLAVEHARGLQDDDRGRLCDGGTRE